MTLYTTFIGIDIGKYEIVVGFHASKSTACFQNDQKGFEAFFKAHKTLLKSSFVVLETTGGYEKLFLHNLVKKGVAVHRANTRQVKAFIHSLGAKGKTDALDAIALARYGYERHDRLALYKPLDKVLTLLQGLAQRRLDLNQILVCEKNRAKAPTATTFVKQQCAQMIETIQQQIDQVTEEMEHWIQKAPELQRKRQVLEKIPGVGKIVSLQLAILLPELGHLNRRQIASLVGLAPYPFESGTKVGYRRTRGGRRDVRNILFMAGMSAAHSKSKLGDKYRFLLNNKGKKKMVALVAIMRNIIVIANHKVKDLALENQKVSLLENAA